MFDYQYSFRYIAFGKGGLLMTDTVVDTVGLFAHYRAIIRGRRLYKPDWELCKLYGNGVGMEAVRVLLRVKFSPEDRMKKKARRKRIKPKPKKAYVAPVSEKTKRILRAVRWRLRAGIYPSAAKMHKRLGCTAYHITHACQRHLTDDEKRLMASMQGSGRKKDIVKRKRGKKKKK